MGIEDYFNVQVEHLRRALRFEPFAVLFRIVEDLYATSIRLMPPDKSPVFGQFLLICHKSFLAAAGLIGQAQPDDAAPITRRVIEVVRLAAAVKADRGNAEKWLAFEERLRRWQDRQEGKKPKSLHVNLDVKHPLIEELMQTWGILSDASAHFTPEYFSSLAWERRETSLFLGYFTRDQRIIEREIVLLAGTHAKVLRVLDWCLDGDFSKHIEWGRLIAELYEKGRPYAAKFEDPQEEDERED